MSKFKSLITITTVSLIVGLVFIQKFIKIREIQCLDHEDKECSQKIVKLISNSKDQKNYIVVNEINNILKNEVLIKKYSIQYMFPDVLLVKVIQRNPVYAVKSKDSNWINLIDADGYVTDIVDSTIFPLLFTDGGLVNQGEKIDNSICFALKIVKLVSQTYKIDSAVLKNESLEVITGEGLKVVFPRSGDIDYLLGSFKLIVSRLNNLELDSTIENNKFKEVDLRYKNPVLR